MVKQENFLDLELYVHYVFVFVCVYNIYELNRYTFSLCFVYMNIENPHSYHSIVFCYAAVILLIRKCLTNFPGPVF